MTYTQMAKMLSQHAESGNVESCKRLIGSFSRTGKNAAQIVAMAAAKSDAAARTLQSVEA